MSHTQTIIAPKPNFRESLQSVAKTVTDALASVLMNKRPPIESLIAENFEAYKKSPERLKLLKFEKQLIEMRELKAKGMLPTECLLPELRTWVEYNRKTFYIQLRQMYLRKEMYPDAERVLKQGAKGSTITIKSNDGNVSETINTDYGKPIRVEF